MFESADAKTQARTHRDIRLRPSRRPTTSTLTPGIIVTAATTVTTPVKLDSTHRNEEISVVAFRENPRHENRWEVCIVSDGNGTSTFLECPRRLEQDYLEGCTIRNGTDIWSAATGIHPTRLAIGNEAYIDIPGTRLLVGKVQQKKQSRRRHRRTEQQRTRLRAHLHLDCVAQQSRGRNFPRSPMGLTPVNHQQRLPARRCHHQPRQEGIPGRLTPVHSPHIIVQSRSPLPLPNDRHQRARGA